MNRPVYIFNEGDIYGITAVKSDDNIKTITFVYKDLDDKHRGFNEINFNEVLKNHEGYKLYALEENGNYFTDTIKINLVDNDSMNDRIDLNIS